MIYDNWLGVSAPQHQHYFKIIILRNRSSNTDDSEQIDGFVERKIIITLHQFVDRSHKIGLSLVSRRTNQFQLIH